MNQRGSLWRAGLVAICGLAAGCGGWVDIDSSRAGKAGARNGVAGDATGGSANPTGGRGGAASNEPPNGSAARNTTAGREGSIDDQPLASGGDDSGPAPTTTACDQGGSTGIAGTIDGARLHEAWEPVSGIWWNRLSHWSSDSQFAGRSFEYFMGGDSTHLSAPADGPQRVRLGVVRAPPSSAVAGQVLCFGDGSLHDTLQLSYHGYSNHARLLGQCPGVPVAGEVELCGSRSNDQCAAPISGTLEGATLSANNLAFRLRDTALLDAESDAFKLYGYYDGSIDQNAPRPLAGHLDEGLLIVFPEARDVGPAVYCLGANSTFDFSNGNQVTTLRGLSKLGDCPSNAGADAVQFCN